MLDAGKGENHFFTFKLSTTSPIQIKFRKCDNVQSGADGSVTHLQQLRFLFRGDCKSRAESALCAINDFQRDDTLGVVK